MSRHRLAAAAAGCLCAAVLAACGGSTAATPSSSAASPAQGVVTPGANQSSASQSSASQTSASQTSASPSSASPGGSGQAAAPNSAPPQSAATPAAPAPGADLALVQPAPFDGLDVWRLDDLRAGAGPDGAWSAKATITNISDTRAAGAFRLTVARGNDEIALLEGESPFLEPGTSAQITLTTTTPHTPGQATYDFQIGGGF